MIDSSLSWAPDHLQPSQNFLNNYGTSDLLSAIARVFLLFQMLAVFPLLMYLIRAQLSWAILGNVFPGFPVTASVFSVKDGLVLRMKNVVLLNGFLVAVCITFAIFLPTVGNILRFRPKPKQSSFLSK